MPKHIADEFKRIDMMEEHIMSFLKISKDHLHELYNKSGKDYVIFTESLYAKILKIQKLKEILR